MNLIWYNFKPFRVLTVYGRGRVPLFGPGPPLLDSSYSPVMGGLLYRITSIRLACYGIIQGREPISLYNEYAEKDMKTSEIKMLNLKQSFIVLSSKEY